MMSELSKNDFANITSLLCMSHKTKPTVQLAYLRWKLKPLFGSGTGTASLIWLLLAASPCLVASRRIRRKII